MKAKLFMLLFLMIFILTACIGKEPLLFQGESENWRVEYHAEYIKEGSEKTSFTIRYIGVGESPKEIEYKIGDGLRGQSPLDNGVLEGGISICDNCASTLENEDLSVTIKWEGKTENLNLKNQQ